MSEVKTYEYAIIRVVPEVHREEFMNVGVILFCKAARFIGVRLHLDKDRLQCFFGNEIDPEQIGHNLNALEKIASGSKDGGPIALEEVPERFRWLTAVRSSVIQTSRPHPGMCTDLEATLDCLMNSFVLREE